MKKLLAAIGGMALLFVGLPAQAITLSIDPPSQNSSASSTVNAALVISGLGNGVAPSLGTFDVDVSFNPAVLGFNSVVFGDPVLGDQLDVLGLGSIIISTPSAGTVNLFELSMDSESDLNTVQADSFILATLTFDALTGGTSALTIAINTVGDAVGDPLSVDIRNGSVTISDGINPVPEPSCLLLMGAGVLGLVGLGNRKKLRRKIPKVTATCTALLVALAVSSPVIAMTFTITDLGTLGGSGSWASRMNASGQVVGGSNISGDSAQTPATSHAFLYSGGVMTDLGTLGGKNSGASGINNSGQIVGGSDIAGNTAQHAFLYSGGVMADLGTLGGSWSWAQSINDDGQIVGFSLTAGDVAQHAFLYSGGVMTDLGTLGGSASWANGINNRGQVVGWSETASGEVHAFILGNGTTMTDLGTLGGIHSEAYYIGDSGQVVGHASTTGDATQHAFLYDGGIMIDLDTPSGRGSLASGINNSKQIVGGSVETGAFLYSDGIIVNLNDLLPARSGWRLDRANGINDLGQITGNGFINGEYHAFLLTPVPTAVPVPEPGTWLLMGASLAGLAASRELFRRGMVNPHTNSEGSQS